jgi:hypothetical protein
MTVPPRWKKLRPRLTKSSDSMLESKLARPPNKLAVYMLPHRLTVLVPGSTALT